MSIGVEKTHIFPQFSFNVPLLLLGMRHALGLLQYNQTSLTECALLENGSHNMEAVEECEPQQMDIKDVNIRPDVEVLHGEFHLPLVTMSRTRCRQDLV